MATQQLIKEMAKFGNLSAARSYAERREKVHMILLGDDGKYWVGLPKHTEKLNKLGYEYTK